MESGHCFVLAELRSTMMAGWSCAQRLFRYENVWQTHADCDGKVRAMWQSGARQRGLHGVVDALAKAQAQLGSWGSGSLATWRRKFANCKSDWISCEVPRWVAARRRKRKSSRNSYGRPCVGRKYGSSSALEYLGCVKGTETLDISRLRLPNGRELTDLPR